MMLHKAESDHCERPERIKSIEYHLKKMKLKDKLFLIDVEECDDKIPLYLHDEEYIKKLRLNTEE